MPETIMSNPMDLIEMPQPSNCAFGHCAGDVADDLLAGVEFRPLVIPASVNAADAGDFVAMTDVRNAIYLEISGNPDERMNAGELLPHYQPSEYEIRHLWLVLLDGRPVGRFGVDIPLEANSRAAYWIIELLHEVWGRGIGSAAHDLVERTASEHGRTVLQSWAEHPSAPGDRIAAPTGFGSIPHDHVARFYLRHGYALEQVERSSILDLTGSFDEIERLRHLAEQVASGYRIVQWMLPTPAEYVDGYAWMKSRMSTDTPAGALEFDEEAWDAARVAIHDERALEGGHTFQITAAQHLESGEMCAFNELCIGSDLTTATQQIDTLVLSNHRGHRLGMLVKCAGLISWREVAPDSPRVVTYNAEENRPMLDINEAIGFVPRVYVGAWKKVLQGEEAAGRRR